MPSLAPRGMAFCLRSWATDEPQGYAPDSGPHPGCSVGLPEQQLTRDPPIQQNCLVAAQRSHHRRHLRRGESEGNAAEGIAQNIEASQGDQYMSIREGPERQPGVAMVDVYPLGCPAEGWGDGAILQQHRVALECLERSFVAALEGELVITKQYASAFFGTSLASTLVSRGVDTVVLVGVSTSGCIRATGVDAVQHGFIPLVVRDAVADRTQETHDANLFDLQAKYAEVIDEATATTYLEEL